MWLPPHSQKKKTENSRCMYRLTISWSMTIFMFYFKHILLNFLLTIRLVCVCVCVFFESLCVSQYILLLFFVKWTSKREKNRHQPVAATTTTPKKRTNSDFGFSLIKGTRNMCRKYNRIMNTSIYFIKHLCYNLYNVFATTLYLCFCLD